jgi:hypothetical protein
VLIRIVIDDHSLTDHDWFGLLWCLLLRSHPFILYRIKIRLLVFILPERFFLISTLGILHLFLLTLLNLLLGLLPKLPFGRQLLIAKLKLLILEPKYLILYVIPTDLILLRLHHLLLMTDIAMTGHMLLTILPTNAILPPPEQLLIDRTGLRVHLGWFEFINGLPCVVGDIRPQPEVHFGLEASRSDFPQTALLFARLPQLMVQTALGIL